MRGYGRRAARTAVASAAGLVGGLAALAVKVVLGDDGEAGLHLRGDRLLVERGPGGVDAVLGDDARLLSHQRLNRTVAQSLDLVRTRIESDDLDGVRLA